MLILDFTQQQGDHTLTVKASLHASGVTAIFGVSGAGKTSLINAIAGLTVPQQGSIRLNDRVLSDTATDIWLPPEQRRIGYVFQDARLFPHYRVRGNLEYGMAKSMRPQFDALVKLLGLESCSTVFPGHYPAAKSSALPLGARC